MSCLEKFRQLLHERGFRLTPQRELILEALHDVQGCITAEALYERVHGIDPGIDLATIYRTLELLANIDFVKCIDTGHKEKLWQFLGTTQPQPHLRCEACGQLIDCRQEELAPLREALRRRYGFEPNLGHLTIPGICFQCQKAG
jgi:Fur family ferric uptake transcriptional regulator